MDKALSQIKKKLETITYLSDGRISICSCLKNIAEQTRSSNDLLIIVDSMKPHELLDVIQLPPSSKTPSTKQPLMMHLLKGDNSSS